VIALYRLQAKGKAKGSDEERGRRGATGGSVERKFFQTNLKQTPVRAGLRVACALSDPVRPVRSGVDALAAAYPVYLRWYIQLWVYLPSRDPMIGDFESV
jgi:hypothetical protein